MGFLPAMQSDLTGIRATKPLRFRALQGAVVDLWHAEGQAGGGGRYTAPHPRAVLFLEDGAQAVQLSAPGFRATGVQAMFVPAGVPVETRITTARRFAHVDLHFDAEALAQRLSGHIAPELLSRPRFLTAPPRLAHMGALLAGALEGSTLLLEGLMLATLAELFAPQPVRAAFSGPQLAAVRSCVMAHLHRQVSLAELAEAAGLSESRFSHVFKQSTGETPHRWQMRLRVEAAAARMTSAPRLGLAEIAADHGFADQAHLGRVFRAHFGTSPAEWRRNRMESSQSQQDHSIHAPLS